MAKKETPAKKEPTAKKLEDAASVAQPETAEERVAKRLTALARLQATLSRIDEIEILRGELPLEVENIENDLAQLQTRLDNTASSAKTLSQSVTAERSKIAQSRELLDKYKAQIDNVRNNREYDNLSKEIEYQELEITLSEKKIREYTQELQARKADIAKYKEQFELRAGDLKAKKLELDSIIQETHEDEEKLRKEAAKQEKEIQDPRVLAFFHRIRNGARNGLAVVPIDRESCGGCFNRIPPQRQLEIKLHKKEIICEYCGRIIIDPDLLKMQ